ncbi:hypothetical protein GCM10009662_67670 [Catellatospora coxensis]|uniref:JAB-N domain-containing protein n=1 Tax=Catellatospora coxensis TaxID=310354 RepID=A0A8J3PDC6_9ACTN|nr:hypothetical protein Cco03nite_76310 [Catellatospora coxensis]
MPWTDDESRLGVEVFRTDDYALIGRLDLHQVLIVVFESVLGIDLSAARFHLYLYAQPDDRDVPGPPSVVNLRSSHGFVRVHITIGDELVYRHTHSLREVVGVPLQAILSQVEPDERFWGYGVTGPGLDAISLVRPAPRAAGAVNMSIGRDRPPMFHIEPIPDPPPPTATPADLGVSEPLAAGADTDWVLLAPDVHEALSRTMPFSGEVEDGGFFVGRVYLDRDRPGRHLINITQAIPAERTGASFLQFTFTGESFLRINEMVSRSGSDLRLLGWYHSHLFAASDGFGLSSTDVDLHTRTFLRDWHVAGLLNISPGTRRLRFYARGGTGMVALPFLIAGDR